MSKGVQTLLACAGSALAAFLASLPTCVPIGIGKVAFGIVVVFLAAILFDVLPAVAAGIGAALGEWAAGAQIELLAFLVMAYVLAGLVTVAFYQHKSKTRSRKAAILSAAVAALVSLFPYFGGTLLVGGDAYTALLMTAIQATVEAGSLLIVVFVLPKSVFTGESNE